MPAGPPRGASGLAAAGHRHGIPSQGMAWAKKHGSALRSAYRHSPSRYPRRSLTTGASNEGRGCCVTSGSTPRPAPTIGVETSRAQLTNFQTRQDDTSRSGGAGLQPTATQRSRSDALAILTPAATVRRIINMTAVASANACAQRSLHETEESPIAVPGSIAGSLDLQIA